MRIDHVIKCIHAKLFVWGFSSHSRNFHSFGDVTVTDEGPHSRSVLMAIKQRGVLSVPYLLWDGPNLYNGNLQGSATLKPWQWSCHYLFIRRRSVPTGDRTKISRLRRQTDAIPNIYSTQTRGRYLECVMDKSYMITHSYNKQFVLK